MHIVFLIPLSIPYFISMTIKNHLLGVLEIAMFMRQGIKRFSNDKREFWRSFIIVALNIPLLPLIVPHIYSNDMALRVLPLGVISTLFVIKYLLVVASEIGLSYIFCKLFKRVDVFRQYVTTSNWTSLTSIVLIIPFLIVLQSEEIDYHDVFKYLLLISFYIYSLSAYITKRVLEIPWSLAIAIAIAGLAINEAFFSLMYIVIDGVT